MTYTQALKATEALVDNGWTEYSIACCKDVNAIVEASNNLLTEFEAAELQETMRNAGFYNMCRVTQEGMVQYYEYR